MISKPENANESTEVVTGRLAKVISAMASREPSPDEVAESMMRLQRLQAVSLPKPVSKFRSLGWSRWVAASVLILCTWFAAQTNVWGNVALRYQEQQSQELSVQKSNQSISFGSPKERTNAPMPTLEPVPSQRTAKQSNPVLRFVLLLHVLALSIGLLGMATSWVGSSWKSFHLFRSRHTIKSLGSKNIELLHRWSLVSYGAGMLLGCIWLMSTQGTFWSWTSREMYGLLTVVIAFLWHQQITVASSEGMLPQFKESLVASVGFGSIVLLYRMGMIDSTTVHSYPMVDSHTIEIVIMAFFGAQIASLLGIRWWRSS